VAEFYANVSFKVTGISAENLREANFVIEDFLDQLALVETTPIVWDDCEWDIWEKEEE
jgi:hypothetical protein